MIVTAKNFPISGEPKIQKASLMVIFSVGKNTAARSVHVLLFWLQNDG
jgi:hypothetical protein